MKPRHILLATLSTAAVLSTGCAQRGLYQWGNYDTALYKYYKSPDQADSLRVQFETHIAALEQLRQKVPPGLYAELGTLYLQKGDRANAALMYAKERDAWPESSGLMTALIRTTTPKSGEAASPPTTPAIKTVDEAKESL